MECQNSPLKVKKEKNEVECQKLWVKRKQKHIKTVWEK